MGVLRDLQTDIEVSATRLFAEYRALLLAEAKVMGVAWDEAEDLVMITFEKYLSNKNNFDPSKGELITYLKKILHNTYVTSLRKKKSCDL